MLQALGLPLTTRLLTHSHWTVDRAKMSKSVGNVADPIKAIDEFGVDLVRYYLARVGGRFKDDVGELNPHLPTPPSYAHAHYAHADWSQSQLQKHSREIVSHLGNLFMRATSAKIMKRVAEVPPRAVTSIADSTALSPLLKMLRALSTTVDGQMRGFQVADAVETVVLALQEVRLGSLHCVVLRIVC